ncbi:hypothetical protein RB653_004464 [Dictyostelium firmibasis]|uniref:Uncharacterized protein n=1 Tax=Dictyostelium firmibasis TaxID=79012 RepID=A0AAN7Z3D5_9MYCE
MKSNVFFFLALISILLCFKFTSSLELEIQVTCTNDCSGSSVSFNTTTGCHPTSDVCTRLPIYNFIHAYQSSISVQLFTDLECQQPASVAYTIGCNQCTLIGPMHYTLLTCF